MSARHKLLRTHRAAGRGASGLLPKAATIRRRQQPAGNPPGDSSSSLTLEICPARKRTSSASGAVHVSQGNPARREAGAMGAATCLRRWWSATALTNASKRSHRQLAPVSGQVNTAEGDLYGPVLGAPDRAAGALFALVKIDGHSVQLCFPNDFAARGERVR